MFVVLLMRGIGSRVVTGLITDQHRGIPGPLVAPCVSRHGTFCLTPGGNTPITGRAPCHHPHSSHTRHYAGPVSAGLTPSCLHTVNIIINTVSEHQSLCHKHQDNSYAWDWTGCHLGGNKDNGCLVTRECAEPGSDLWLTTPRSHLQHGAIRAIEEAGAE